MNASTKLLLLLLLTVLAIEGAHGQASSFTYQGQLRQSGEPFTGMADLEFRLYDQLSDGTQIGGAQSLDDVPVEDGLFQVELDFGATAFDGSDRFLEVTVDGAALIPRQKVTATPYALLATGLASGSVGGGSIDPTEVQLRVVGTCPSGEYVQQINQDGSVVCGLDALGSGDITAISAGTGLSGGGSVGAIGIALDTGFTDNRYWRHGGNAGTNPVTDFIGTIDSSPLDIRVEGNRAVRYEWGFSSSGAPNIIGGIDANSLPDNYEASIIAGGGLAGAPNSILGNASVISGGIGNVIDGNWSVIPGGRANTANGNDSVAMGQGATANHNNVFVWNDGGSFASTGPDQFLIDAGGGVGIGTNNPSDLLHLSLPAGDAMRVQIAGQTRFRIHDNGGISVGVNTIPPPDGLVVRGRIRYETPVIDELTLGASSFVSTDPGLDRNYRRLESGLQIIPTVCGTSSRGFEATAHFPDNATVRMVRVAATENDPANNLNVDLRRMNRTGTSSRLMARVTTSGSSSTVRFFEDSTIDGGEVRSNFVYRVFVYGDCSLGSTILHSVGIQYETERVQ